LNIDNIQKTISELWDSLVPAIIRALITLFIINSFFPSTTIFDLLRPISERISIVSSNQLQGHFQTYGIDKLMPFLTFFLILFFISLINRLILLMNKVWPVHIHIDQHNIYIDKDLRSNLAQIWTQYSQIQNVDDLIFLINYKYEIGRANFKSNSIFSNDYWQKRVDKFYGILAFIGFLNIVFVTTSIIFLLTSPSLGTFFLNLSLFIIIKTIVLAYSIYNLRKAVIQSNFNKLLFLKSSLLDELKDQIADNEAINEKLQKIKERKATVLIRKLPFEMSVFNIDINLLLYYSEIGESSYNLYGDPVNSYTFGLVVNLFRKFRKILKK
jgi:hypothetical protein